MTRTTHVRETPYSKFALGCRVWYSRVECGSGKGDQPGFMTLGPNMVDPSYNFIKKAPFYHDCKTLRDFLSVQGWGRDQDT